MGSFIDNNLVSGEEVLAEASLHKIIYLAGIIWCLLGLVFWPSLLLGLLLLLWAYLRLRTTEFALTSKRVVAKWGVLSRHTIELNLNKIEGVNVSQGLLGRMLNYGTVALVGTGGSVEPMKMIADPFAIKKSIQGHLET